MIDDERIYYEMSRLLTDYSALTTNKNDRTMLDNDRILTLHPQGKKGVNILREKYNLIKDFIIQKIRQHGTISYEDLSELAEEELASSFDGKPVWYIVTVKLDLEARGIIERVPKTSPHQLRMKE